MTQEKVVEVDGEGEEEKDVKEPGKDVEVEEDDEDEEPYEVQIIETGDMLKLKQALDDEVVEFVCGKESDLDLGYEPNNKSENVKICLMALACVCAMVAQVRCSLQYFTIILFIFKP